jgi:site-specific recombinase XerD
VGAGAKSFLTLQAPHRPLSHGGLYHLASRVLCARGLRLQPHGPHALRHACATRLLSQGLSFKHIGDHLGHRHADATAVYAKVDVPSTAAVFINRRGQPLTRFGVHDLVARYGRTVTRDLPSLQQKRLSPHTIRHTTATHLLRAGVDINTIRAWLGHVSVDTTNIYAEIDLAAKAKALEICAIHPDAGGATRVEGQHRSPRLSSESVIIRYVASAVRTRERFGSQLRSTSHNCGRHTNHLMWTTT